MTCKRCEEDFEPQSNPPEDLCRRCTIEAVDDTRSRGCEDRWVFQDEIGGF